MASTDQPCVILNCGEKDGLRMTVQVGPFVSMAQASEAAERLTRDCPGVIATVCRNYDSRQPDDAELAERLTEARRTAAEMLRICHPQGTPTVSVSQPARPSTFPSPLHGRIKPGYVETQVIAYLPKHGRVAIPPVVGHSLAGAVAAEIQRDYPGAEVWTHDMQRGTGEGFAEACEVSDQVQQAFVATAGKPRRGIALMERLRLIHPDQSGAGTARAPSPKATAPAPATRT